MSCMLQTAQFGVLHCMHLDVLLIRYPLGQLVHDVLELQVLQLESHAKHLPLDK